MIKVKTRAGESIQQMVKRFKKICEKEVDLFGPNGNTTLTYKLFRFFLKYTAPIAILAVILAVIFLGKDFS